MIWHFPDVREKKRKKEKFANREHIQILDNINGV